MVDSAKGASQRIDTISGIHCLGTWMSVAHYMAIHQAVADISYCGPKWWKLTLDPARVKTTQEHS